MDERTVLKRHNKTLLLSHVACPAKYRRKDFREEVESTLKETCMGRHELHFVEIGDFFDFRYVIESGEVLSGLCKISDPKEHEQRFTYYSLLFLIDIPEDKTHHEVDVLMAKMGLGQFRRHLPHVEHVMTTPPSFR